VKIIPYFKGGLAPFDVQLVDVSAHGIQFHHGEELPVGAEFLVLLPRSGKAPVPMLCWVKHCRMGKSKKYSVGAEFVCVAGHQVAKTHAPENAPELQKIRDEMFGG
jgi:hypothetical protein